jgi:outer membrane protein assembly factor BamA
LVTAAVACFVARPGRAETPAPSEPEKTEKPPKPPDDGWPDVSSFLDEKYGFLPIAMPITEPAVGYGAAGGLTFISKPLGAAAQGLGRPNITFVGGFGTQNGSWGVFAADLRYWLDDRVQTIGAGIYASVNLDFHGVGKDTELEDNPIRYNLNPKGGMANVRYRFGDSLLWAGLGYMFARMDVSVEAPEDVQRLPDYDDAMNIGGLTLAATYDTRNNFFTPTRGFYLEGSFSPYGKLLGGDDTFERLAVTGIQYLALPEGFYLGVRDDFQAAFGDAPYFLYPYISLRGVPVMRYQGEEMASLEAELRWQFMKRLSLVGFAGGGVAWNDFERLDNTLTVVSGGGGFRYELARRYGIHMGVDVAFSRDTAAFYIQVGSAWMRP